jgi:hypothetical protein
MRLVSFSNLVKVTRSGLIFPSVTLDADNDAEYEIIEVPFLGFNDTDFMEFNGIKTLTANFEPRIIDGVLHLCKSRGTFKKRLLFIHPFLMIDGGDFGSFPESVVPDSIFKFKTGTPDLGYFYEMMFILDPDIKYDILYYSEELGKVTQYFIIWDYFKDFVEVTYTKLE